MALAAKATSPGQFVRKYTNSSARRSPGIADFEEE
jgi:hypothetical protein